MSTKFYTLLIALLTTTLISAQTKKEKDAEAIKKMCGCYEVSFNFSETFNYSKDSLYKPSDNKITGGLEWAQLITDDDENISIQHLLQVGDPAKPYIVKHWRQDWLYENEEFYMYDGDNKWDYVLKPEEEVEGQWTQKVYQVDDSPRYEGSATWVHVDGKSYWENTTPAPLPRREYTTRSDYNVTIRGNRHEITPFGWVHDQDNKKVIRKNGEEDFVLAQEKGYNVYKKVEDSRCQAAADWWKQNEEKWAMVRNKWEDVFSRDENLILEEKVNNSPLYKYLFEEEYSSEEKIEEIISSFVK
ncbi:hypothetical protein L1I30_01700 [Gillisia sp. M10.2A]|uniref:Uncharacterized protein n=1 Tax=Gillisia lutea TaxID=2909668 RepID=A0ABS9EG33_9FLAO|nr:DUF6607 family protein [Gillisia lutea]MCF4100368.1 hypothetical protein [Gillisia lutea]